MFEVFDHTADLGLRVRAATLEQLFEEGGRALYSVIVSSLDDVQLVTTKRIDLSGGQVDFLFFDWLSELNYIFESDRLVLSDFEVKIQNGVLEAVCRGEPVDPQRHQLEHEVKAITYHGLRVVQTSDGWLAEVIVDI